MNKIASPVDMNWTVLTHNKNGIAKASTVAEVLGRSSAKLDSTFTYEYYTDVPAEPILDIRRRGKYVFFGKVLDLETPIFESRGVNEYLPALAPNNNIYVNDIDNYEFIPAAGLSYTGTTLTTNKLKYASITVYSSILTSVSAPSITHGGFTFSNTTSPLTSVSYDNAESLYTLITFQAYPTKSYTFKSLRAPKATYIAQVNIGGAYGFDTLDLSNAERVGTISVESTESALLIDLPKVTEAYGIAGYFTDKISYNLPKLEKCGFLQLRSLNQTTLDLPMLKKCGSFMLGEPYNSISSPLTTLNIPVLEQTGWISLARLAASTINFPALKRIGYFENNPNSGYIEIGSYTALTSFTLPAIEYIGKTCYYGCGIPRNASIKFSSNTPNLTTFTFGSSLKEVAGGVYFTSCSLNQASVDNILVRLAALDGTNGTTVYQNKTVQITGTSATPSATGLAAKATLVARGCSVTHN